MTMNHWYQSMYQMFELVSDFIEAWLCYGFVGLFLPDRVRGKVLFFILSLVLVGSVRAMDILDIDPMISTLWFVFYICMTTVVLFQVNLFYAVSLVSFYILCLYVINYFCMSVMGVIAGNRQFAQFILNQLSLLRCIYLAADTALLFLLYMLIRRAFKGGAALQPADAVHHFPSGHSGHYLPVSGHPSGYLRDYPVQLEPVPRHGAVFYFSPALLFQLHEGA